MRAVRDLKIAARAAEGVSRQDLASEYDLSVRAIDSVLQRVTKMRIAIDEAPVELLESAMRTSKMLISAFCEVADSCKHSNPSAAVGALKGAHQVSSEYLDLCAHVGRMPRWDLVRSESELLALADLLVRKLREVDEGVITVSEMRRLVEDAIESPGGLS